MPTASHFELLPSDDDKTLSITINCRPCTVGEHWTVAAALIAHGHAACRCAASGTPRGPFCFSGACFECLVEIDGIPDRQACLTPVAPGMEVVLDIPSEPPP